MRLRDYTFTLLLALVDASAPGAQAPTESGSTVVKSPDPVPPYKDGRPTAQYRLDALDPKVQTQEPGKIR